MSKREKGNLEDNVFIGLILVLMFVCAVGVIALLIVEDGSDYDIPLEHYEEVAEVYTKEHKTSTSTSVVNHIDKKGEWGNYKIQVVKDGSIVEFDLSEKSKNKSDEKVDVNVLDDDDELSQYTYYLTNERIIYNISTKATSNEVKELLNRKIKRR